MSKSKKLFSIALAVLLALQLLLIPTFAEGETATGKYTTADNLPLIYGAGESLDDFEDVTLAETETVTNGDIIIDAYRSYNGTKLTAKVLPDIIKNLKNNYELVNVSDLIYKENYHMNHEGRQILD